MTQAEWREISDRNDYALAEKVLIDLFGYDLNTRFKDIDLISLRNLIFVLRSWG